jgi:hypothetical protein
MLALQVRGGTYAVVSRDKVKVKVDEGRLVSPSVRLDGDGYDLTVLPYDWSEARSALRDSGWLADT